jgi:integrase
MSQMASARGRLTALKVERSKAPGMYGDGGGLYLQVTSAGARSWIFRYRLNGYLSKTGKPLSREMGLGSLVVMSLADARDRAAECRRLLNDGVDPLEAKRATRTQAALDAAKALTFSKAAENYIAAHRAGWRNAKHAAQWTTTLATYVNPVFGDLPVQTIDVALVMKVIEPLWKRAPETASRTRGRIEAVLDWAKVRGYRTGENPARWRGHLDHLLPKRSKVQKVAHLAALPYIEIGAFMAELREHDAIAARALEFAILTAARTGEVLGARWGEIDLQAKLWIVPADRMKSGRQHRIPLSDPALAILASLPHNSEFVFQLGDDAMRRMLVRMGRGEITAHGFRSSFRDWVAERTNFPREIAEAALAHVVGDKVEAAYRRSDLFDKRRKLMQAWGDYCAVPSHPRGEVVPLHGERSEIGFR